MSKAAVVTSGLVIVRVAFHVSNLPTMETEDFTSNVTELETGVTSKTGTCARPNGVSKAVATRQTIAFRMRKSRHWRLRCQLVKMPVRGQTLTRRLPRNHTQIRQPIHKELHRQRHQQQPHDPHQNANTR